MNFKSWAFIYTCNLKLLYLLRVRPLVQSRLNFPWTRPGSQRVSSRRDNQWVVEPHGLWNHTDFGWITILPLAMWLIAAQYAFMSIAFLFYINTRYIPASQMQIQVLGPAESQRMRSRCSQFKKKLNVLLVHTRAGLRITKLKCLPEV